MPDNEWRQQTYCSECGKGDTISEKSWKNSTTWRSHKDGGKLKSVIWRCSNCMASKYVYRYFKEELK